MHSRVNELNHWITRLAPSDPVAHWTAIITSVEEIPAMTPAEEAASKERAIKAHADELAKCNKALDDAITQVERKNGRAPKNYGLKLAGEYNQRDVRRIWGQTWERKLFAAREEGEIPYRQDGRAFIYEGLDLIGWRAHLEKK